jgi:hypothetical protein
MEKKNKKCFEKWKVCQNGHLIFKMPPNCKRELCKVTCPPHTLKTSY